MGPYAGKPPMEVGARGCIVPYCVCVPYIKLDEVLQFGSCALRREQYSTDINRLECIAYSKTSRRPTLSSRNFPLLFDHNIITRSLTQGICCTSFSVCLWPGVLNYEDSSSKKSSCIPSLRNCHWFSTRSLIRRKYYSVSLSYRILTADIAKWRGIAGAHFRQGTTENYLNLLVIFSNNLKLF